MAARRRSIAFLITACVVFTSTLILVALAVTFEWQEYGWARTELKVATQRLSRQLAIALALPAWNFDRTQIDSVLDAVMETPAIAAITVTVNGSTFYGRTRDANWRSVPATQGPAAAAALLSASEPIRLAAATRGAPASVAVDTLGRVTVYSTLQFARQRVRDTLIRTGLIIAASDLLLVVLLYAAIYRLALQPLRRLQAHAAAVAAGADAVAGLGGSRFFGEFEQLRESLSTLLGLLQSRLRALGEEQGRYRHLMSEMLRLQDVERRHIGRELHDSIGQSLAALEINLSLLQRGAASPEANPERLLRESVAIARHCLSAIRTTSYLLHPPLLDELGLATALRWLVDGFRKRSNIQLDALIPESLERLPQDIELILFRVAQEALTNVYRHSGARSAELRLSRDAESVTLSVADTGHGFGAYTAHATLDQGDPRFGVGLTGMRERVREVGGTLTIHSDATGTIVTASLPVPDG